MHYDIVKEVQAANPGFKEKVEHTQALYATVKEMIQTNIDIISIDKEITETFIKSVEEGGDNLLKEKLDSLNTSLGIFKAIQAKTNALMREGVTDQAYADNLVGSFKLILKRMGLLISKL